MLLLLFLEQGDAIIPMLWFRNVTPQFNVHNETLQTMHCSFTCPSPFPSPCGGLEKRLGGTEGKNYVLRSEVTGNNNGIKKQTVIATISITEGTSTT